MTETVFVDQKTDFELPTIHLGGFADSLRFHLYSFQGYLFGIFVYLGTHHIASNWFEILHTSPNHCLLLIKQSLSKLWCTAEWFLEFTSGYNIYHFLFSSSITESLQILAKSLETLHKWPKQSSLMKKSALNCPRYILVVLQTVQDFSSIYSFGGLSLWYLCSFGKCPYCIKLIWNFPHINESLRVVYRTKF